MRREYAGLEQELQREDYKILLHELKEKTEFLRRFDTWADVVVFMRDRISNDRLTDEVLRPIFEAHKKSKDHRWRTILLVIFWPGLESIHWRKQGWDMDVEERWQNVVWNFLQVVCRIDVSRRHNRLVQKVINDTIHHLHDEYRQIWEIKSHEIMSDAAKIESFVSIGRPCLEVNEEAEIRKLKTHLQDGRISEADFLLLVGTRVYGKSVADYVREAGLDYQITKKRRQRAEAAIRENKNKSKKFVPKNEKYPPLYGVGNLNREG